MIGILSDLRLYYWVELVGVLFQKSLGKAGLNSGIEVLVNYKKVILDR
jgi:hypothetical protein